jgi:nucleoside-diphosphate-sugar epimerase
MSIALLTGGTGFVGGYVLNALVQKGFHVRCLVRGTSRTENLCNQGAMLVFGDLADRESLTHAARGVDVVIHVGGLMKALTPEELMHVNGQGTAHLAAVCADCPNPPVLILVSSIVAAGTSVQDRPRTETDDCQPVSHYGRSKRAGELAVAACADRVPVTIIRPPFVFGGGDRSGFYLFRPIRRFGIHPVPGMRHRRRMSLVHAADLAEAIVIAAERGARVDVADAETDHFRQGCYFVCDDQHPRYSHLGDMIGRAMGRSRVFKLPAPDTLSKVLGAAASCVAYLRGRAGVFSLDKAREGAAGSWTCSAQKIKQELGFSPAASLDARLRETVDWYQKEGWF